LTLFLLVNLKVVWHIDDSRDDNHDERHYKVGLMQADGLNELATRSAGSGDDGDPFPGRTGNASFTFKSNPSSRSYTGRDSAVSIMNISAPAPTMTMDITV
jgi:immune inhibitor A